MMHLWMIFLEIFNFFGASAAVLQDYRLFMRDQLALTLRWPCSSLVTAWERSFTGVFAFAGPGAVCILSKIIFTSFPIKPSIASDTCDVGRPCFLLCKGECQEQKERIKE